MTGGLRVLVAALVALMGVHGIQNMQAWSDEIALVFHDHVEPQQHIRGLQIAVDQALAVRVR